MTSTIVQRIAVSVTKNKSLHIYMWYQNVLGNYMLSFIGTWNTVIYNSRNFPNMVQELSAPSFTSCTWENNGKKLCFAFMHANWDKWWLIIMITKTQVSYLGVSVFRTVYTYISHENIQAINNQKLLLQN